MRVESREEKDQNNFKSPHWEGKKGKIIIPAYTGVHRFSSKEMLISWSLGTHFTSSNINGATLPRDIFLFDICGEIY